MGDDKVMHMSRTLVFAALALAAAATVATPSASELPQAARHRPNLSAGAKRGLAFARTRCAGCHAVTANTISPNPESPPFEDIANFPDLTSATLRQFLRDSHNYPAAMNFRVEAARIRDLADYIVTMKKTGYRPVM